MHAPRDRQKQGNTGDSRHAAGGDNVAQVLHAQTHFRVSGYLFRDLQLTALGVRRKYHAITLTDAMRSVILAQSHS